MIEMTCLTLTGTQHCVQGEDRSYLVIKNPTLSQLSYRCSFYSRTNCSALNSDLFWKTIVDSPSCTCGAIVNAYHFFFMRGRYTNQRNDLLHDLNFIQNINL